MRRFSKGEIKMLKSFAKKTALLVCTLMMVMTSTNVYATSIGTELNPACEVSTDLQNSPIERDGFIHFETREEANAFINQLYEALNNDEYEVVSAGTMTESSVMRVGPGNPACCNPNLPNTYHTKKALTGQDAPALSTVYLDLYTDYYCKCTDTSPNQPHKAKCKIITSATASCSFSGLTFGLHTEDVTVTCRIHDNARGFQSIMRGTVVIGVDIGGFGEVVRVPVSTAHAYVLPNNE